MQLNPCTRNERKNIISVQFFSESAFSTSVFRQICWVSLILYIPRNKKGPPDFYTFFQGKFRQSMYEYIIRKISIKNQMYIHTEIYTNG